MTTTILAEGKTKILRPGSQDNEVLVEFKDAATAFNAQKKMDVPGKGALNARISAILFDALNQAGIPTCFVRTGSRPNELVYRHLSMIPLEVVVRNVALGSIVKRFGLEEGQAFTRPVIEFFHKSADDPLMAESLIEEMGLVPASTSLEAIRRLSFQINEIFIELFESRGIRCADFKLEFGTDRHGRLMLGDELSPDNFRLRDAETGAVLDKDVFRLDLGDLQETYQSLLERLEGPGKPVPKTERQYRAEVRVHSRRNILSPESRTILDSLHVLGFSNVETLQAGKRFTLTLTAPSMAEAERQLRQLAGDVLSNPVIEDLEYTLGYDA